MTKHYGWIYQALSAIPVLILGAMLVRFGRHAGVAATMHLTSGYYADFMHALFGWSEPYVQREQIHRAGRFPSWWREGVVMAAFIAAQWFQVLRAGKGHLSDAIEYLAVSLFAAGGSYLADAAQTPAQAFFFGVAGAFIQLLAKGLVSLFRRDNSEAEAWAGRYLLRSIAIAILGATAFIVILAGIRYAGA